MRLKDDHAAPSADITILSIIDLVRARLLSITGSDLHLGYFRAEILRLGSSHGGGGGQYIYMMSCSVNIFHLRSYAYKSRISCKKFFSYPGGLSSTLVRVACLSFAQPARQDPG